MKHYVGEVSSSSDITSWLLKRDHELIKEFMRWIYKEKRLRVDRKTLVFWDDDKPSFKKGPVGFFPSTDQKYTTKDALMDAFAKHYNFFDTRNPNTESIIPAIQGWEGAIGSLVGNIPSDWPVTKQHAIALLRYLSYNGLPDGYEKIDLLKHYDVLYWPISKLPSGYGKLDAFEGMKTSEKNNFKKEVNKKLVGLRRVEKEDEVLALEQWWKTDGKLNPWTWLYIAMFQWYKDIPPLLSVRDYPMTINITIKDYEPKSDDDSAEKSDLTFPQFIRLAEELKKTKSTFNLNITKRKLKLWKPKTKNVGKGTPKN